MLREPGGDALRVAEAAPLGDAIELFRSYPNLRLVAVVDDSARPIGAILEQDIRAILYNPFGHSLLMNPSFASTAASRARPCPTAEADLTIGALLDLYARAGGSEGLLLTRGGRFHGILSNRTLLRLAGEREVELATARARRLERGAKASRQFLSEVDRFADDLADVAEAIDDAADGTVQRLALFRARSAHSAAIAQRSADGMGALAEHSALLATTIRRLRDDAATARSSATEAIALSEAGSRGGRALGEAARAIDEHLGLIRKVAVQAHMLSINAAIEAARLGAQGSGFTVVARELRQFAGQTRGAVATIGERIGEIRVIADEVAASHGAVEQVVRGLDAISRSVADAIGAQAESARLIAANVESATQASAALRDDAADNARMIDTAAAGADGLRRMADALTGHARTLRARVDGFLGKLTPSA